VHISAPAPSQLCIPRKPPHSDNSRFVRHG
jgi:hypothetical protein